MKNEQSREAWHKWMEITRPLDDARGLALLADIQCHESISDEEASENAFRALISATRGLLEKAASLLPDIEPKTTKEAA